MSVVSVEWGSIGGLIKEWGVGQGLIENWHQIGKMHIFLCKCSSRIDNGLPLENWQINIGLTDWYCIGGLNLWIGLGLECDVARCVHYTFVLVMDQQIAKELVQDWD